MISWLKWLLGHVRAWFQVFMGISDSETLQLHMDDFPITASLGPIDRLISQLQSLEGSKHKLPVDLSAHQICLLTKHLKEFRSPMKKLSEMEDTSFIDKWWMKEVRELCYDTEDYLEEVMMQCGAGAPRTWIPAPLQLGRIAGIIIYWIHSKMKWRPQLSHFLARANVLKGRCPSPVYKENADDISLNKDIKADFSLHKEYRADIENLTAQLVEMLAFQDKQIQLKVVPLYGFAGAGKTMLARTVYAKYKRRFHCWAFVRVSRNPDIRCILTSILSQIKAPLPSPPSEVQDLIVSIRRHLNHKRYLIVIDDIRRTSVWDIISRALPADRCGSRIIITTESEHVASACSGYYLGSTILKMDARTACTDTITSEDINLRYHNLPLHLRTCLLFFSMYPEGWTSTKDDLVKQWIAEGIIPAIKSQDTEQISEIPTNKTEEIAEVPQDKRDDISDILEDRVEEIAELPRDQTWEISQTNQDQREEIARGYFDELITRGMIQPVDINHNGEVLSCTVHHMVLDLIRYKSKEDNFIVVVDNLESTLGHPDIVRRLSVQFGCEKGASIPESIIVSHVRSLTFYGFHECAPSFAEYGLLRVLILNTWADEDKIFDLTRIGDLYHLIYLKIECNITVRLPSMIRRLQHLCTLEIHAQVVALPLDIGHLKKLTQVHCPSEADVMDLGDLTSLLDLQLTCSTVENLEDNMKRLHSVLQKLSSLRCLAVVPASGSCRVNTLPANLSRMYISCDSLCILSPAPANLLRLELSRYCCIFSRVPRWIRELHQLCILEIAVRELSREDIGILRGLLALTTLSLHVQPTPEEKIVFSKEGFSVLRYFKFTCTAPWLEFEAGAMPNLEKLKLCFNSPIVDEQGTTRTIIIGRLLGLKEFSAIIGSGVDAESAWWKAIRNDPRNPEVQLTGMIYYGDKDRGMVTREASGEDGYKEDDIRVADGAVEPEWTAAESALKDAIPLHSKLHSEVNVKRADWIEEEYGSAENQHLIQEKHPPSEQPGKIKEDSDEDIKQHCDSESASALYSFPHHDTKKKESISRLRLELKETRTMRKYLLSLAILAASITYQAWMNPPPDVWPNGHQGGSPILLMTYSWRYKVFFYCNAFAFVASVCIFIIAMLLSHKLHSLQAVMIIDLLGLVVAYVAGSSRDARTSLGVITVAVGILVYIPIHMVFFTLEHSEKEVEEDKSMQEMRKMLLLLAILAATITYQAGLTPPGILETNYPRRYQAFFYCNSTSFMSSIAAIILLVNPNLYKFSIQCNLLYVLAMADSFGLVGAYAAGSSRHMRTCVVVILLGLLSAVWLLNKKPTREEGLGLGKNEASTSGEEEDLSSAVRNQPNTPSNKEEGQSDEKKTRKYMMIMAILVASVTFQAGGVWLDSTNGPAVGDPVLWDSSKRWYVLFFHSNLVLFRTAVLVILLLLLEEQIDLRRLGVGNLLVRLSIKLGLGLQFKVRNLLVRLRARLRLAALHCHARVTDLML